jgi:glycosyltransferase involved in cell wall biosynthesis
LQWLQRKISTNTFLLDESMQPELKVRKILGRTYLNENRLAEALDVFSKILVDYPDDLETLLILGNFYLASGDGKTARSIYLRAREVDPENKSIERQIALAKEMDDDGLGESAPTDMPAVARLLQRLTGKTNEIDENDIMRVATLLDKIINSESPAEMVSQHLDKIDELLPALIELNIRQAYADGRPDLAEGLRNLQLNINYQLVSKEENSLEMEDTDSTSSRFNGNVLMLVPDLEDESCRITLLKKALESLNCRVNERVEYIPGRDSKPDVVITSNPHTNPRLIDSLSALSAVGVPIILDLDADFESQPVSHHDYNKQGLGTQARSNAYAAALSLAHMVSVPSEMQAVSLRNVAEQTCVLPDGWSQQNKLWEKDPPSHDTINIGWVGSSGQLEDLVSIRRFIIRITREFPNTRVVIIGNPGAYRLFESLPENRRLYLPVVSHEEFPYLLSQLDILLVPLRNTPYNLSLPDSMLMQAGARGIPWIASAIPAFRRWSSGGILCESLDEWHLNLRHLVMDKELRSNLGKAGRNAARSREMDYVGKAWLEKIDQVMTTKTVPARDRNSSQLFP